MKVKILKISSDLSKVIIDIKIMVSKSIELDGAIFNLSDMEEILDPIELSCDSKNRTIIYKVIFPLTEKFKKYNDGIISTVIKISGYYHIFYHKIFNFDVVEEITQEDEISEAEVYFENDSYKEENEVYNQRLKEDKWYRLLSECSKTYYSDEYIGEGILNYESFYVCLKSIVVKNEGGDAFITIDLTIDNPCNKKIYIYMSDINLNKDRKANSFIAKLSAKTKNFRIKKNIKIKNFDDLIDLKFRIGYFQTSNSNCSVIKSDYVKLTIIPKNIEFGVDLIETDKDCDFYSIRTNYLDRREMHGYYAYLFDFELEDYDVKYNLLNIETLYMLERVLEFKFNFVVKGILWSSILTDVCCCLINNGIRFDAFEGSIIKSINNPKQVDIWEEDNEIKIPFRYIFKDSEIGKLEKGAKLIFYFKDGLKNYIIRKTYIYDECWYDEELIAIPY